MRNLAHLLIQISAETELLKIGIMSNVMTGILSVVMAVEGSASLRTCGLAK